MSPALAFPKPTPYCLLNADAKRDAARHWRLVVAAVRKRDGRICRICGKRGSDPHHVIPKSLGGPDTTGNTLSTCRTCHRWRHSGLLRIAGNADRRIKVECDLRLATYGFRGTFWR